MKTNKAVKKSRKTTCNVLIRSYPGEIADQVKAMTGEKTLSKALVSVSRMYIDLKQEHEKMVSEYLALQGKCLDMDSKIGTFIESFDALRTFSGEGK